LLFFSTQPMEGKTMLAANLAQKLAGQGKKVLLLNYNPASLQKEENTPGNNAAASTLRQRIPLLSRLLGYPDTRIDYNSPMLATPADSLPRAAYQVYNINEKFSSVKNYRQILETNGLHTDVDPDYVFIELPALLYHPYPADLVSSADLPVLVCRSNRTWSEADQSALDVLMKLTVHQTHFMLNGVKLPVVESVLGELPKKRSQFRRMLKNFFRLQFHSQNYL